MPVHSQELPLGGQDWNHGEGCLQIQFGHEGSFVELARERHSMLAQCAWLYELSSVLSGNPPFSFHRGATTMLDCGDRLGGGARVLEKRKCRMRRIFLGRLEDTVDHRNSGKGGTRSW